MKNREDRRGFVPVLEVAIVLLGIALVVLGVLDIFLTVFHTDRDGPMSVTLNRVVWRLAIAAARAFPRQARELLALAGAVMIAATVLAWMVVEVVGFALMAWPFMPTHFDLGARGTATFADAIYWSGATLATLGYGDIAPLTPAWRVIAIVEALAGFALVGAAVAFLLEVFQGVDHRDRMALRIYSETRRTWDGAAFLLRVLEEQGAHQARQHVEAWAEEVRALHERLYRFQPLAFYVRTRSEKHAPERMLEAVAEVALTAALLARVPGLPSLRPAAEEIAIAYVEFARSAILHHGSRRALRAIDAPTPDERDRAHVLDLWKKLQRDLHLTGPPWSDDAQERELLELAARLRVFLEEVDRITRWRSVRALP